MAEFGARVVVEGDASKAISELERLKSSLGGVGKGGQAAGQGVGQLDGNLQKLMRGDPKSALMGVVGSLGPMGAAAIAAAGGIGALWHEFDKATEAVKQQIDGVDNLADRYSLTMHAANELLNVSKIFGVEVNSLGRVFKTLASKGIAPSVDGLLQVKKRLDLISDPTKRTNEAFRLLGRGALLLADFLASDNKQLEVWVARAKSLQSVTKRMTDDQDEFNRTMGYYKAVAENANVTIFGTTLGLKQQIQEWWAAQSAIGANALALQKFGVYGNAAGMNIDKTTQLLKIFQENQEAGIKLTLDEANSLLVSNQFREAYNKHLGRTPALVQAAEVETEGLTDALAALQPYLQNNVTVKTYGLNAAVSGAQRLLSYLQEVSDRTWGIFVNGTYVGPDVVSGLPPSGGGGGGPKKTLAPWATAADRAYAAAHPELYKAAGGSLGGGISLVGEAGPELIVGNTVIPATLTKQLLALGIMPTAHHMLVEGGGGSTNTSIAYAGLTDAQKKSLTGGGTKTTTTATSTSTSTATGGGGGGTTAVVTAVQQETQAILAAMPGAEALAQAVTAPMQSQTAAITASNADLSGKLDVMIALLQRAATDSGVGRAVRDNLAQRI